MLPATRQRWHSRPYPSRSWYSTKRPRVQIAAATLSGNSLRQTVHTHRASVYQAAKLVAALLRVAEVTVGLVESNGSLPPGLWLTSPAGWLPRTGISSGTLRSAVEYGLPFYASLLILDRNWWIFLYMMKFICHKGSASTTQKRQYIHILENKNVYMYTVSQKNKTPNSCP